MASKRRTNSNTKHYKLLRPVPLEKIIKSIKKLPPVAEKKSNA